MHVVLIETSGNQRYIFATNKLRENVGASELTYRVGTKTVLQAVEKITGKKIYEDDDLSGSKLRRNLLDEDKNPPIEKDDKKVEVIVATSGKAILLVDDGEDRILSKQIVRQVTHTSLKEMPGLTVHGAISSEMTNGLSSIHEAIGEVHRKLEDVRHQVPSNEQRFLRLPFFAQCKTSGLPAQTTDKEGENTILVSKLSKVKSDNKLDGVNRIAEIVGGFNLIDPENIEKCAWTAVIHADGNGLGQVFLNFNDYAGSDHNGKGDGRQYIDEYRKFSLALDVCTINATKTSLEHLWSFVAKREAERKEVSELSKDELNNLQLPVVPLVLGGDDLTVLCDGEYAIKFTHDFLTAFEEDTQKDHDLVGDVVKRIALRAFGKDYLGICAGIAIVKPHFPFHQAYELAKSLLDSAKNVKEEIKHLHQNKSVALPASAVDFHILYDSAYSELDTIRQRLQVDEDKTWLYTKPYVVTDEGELSTVTDKAWFERRKFSELAKRVNKMRAEDADDPNKRALPNSQLHGLREALFLGSQEADARMTLIKQRYENQGFTDLLVDKKSLFFAEKNGEEKERATHFMDALDAVNFWKGFDA
jgi:hypothetical protein